MKKILPRVTDCKLVVDPTRLIAPQWYTPASESAMFLIVSDGVILPQVPLQLASLNVQIKTYKNKTHTSLR